MLLNSDAARIPLADKSIHCVVTSPPYWGLRKYSGEQGRIWGGDPECVHEWGESLSIKGKVGHGKGNSTLTGGRDSWENREGGNTGQFCQLCGAWYGGLGLEPTPDLFIQHMVEIFREVRRVLRDDGVVWMNLGDCYASGGKSGEGEKRITSSKLHASPTDLSLNAQRRAPVPPGFSQGNLMLMPHRVAIALQDDGWIIRNDLVWFKRNPMPESVNGWRFQRERKRTGADPRREYSPTHNNHAQRQHDGPDKFAQPEYEYGEDYELRKGSWRHTRAHEYIFQLTKQMQYWSNQEAVREKAINEGRVVSYDGSQKNTGHQNPTYPGSSGPVDILISGRNPRSVLDIPTAPYKHAHYATYPPNLIAPLIRATCPRWACPVCGQGWSPVVERDYELLTGSTGQKTNASDPRGLVRFSDGKKMKLNSSVKEYRPTCEHPHTIEEAVPGIVLDPFIGSGTTGAVARELQLRWVGLDISMEYIDLQAKVRTKSGSPSNTLEGLPLFERKSE